MPRCCSQQHLRVPVKGNFRVGFPLFPRTHPPPPAGVALHPPARPSSPHSSVAATSGGAGAAPSGLRLLYVIFLALLPRGALCPSAAEAMAKYLAQILMVGVQVVGRAFARALRQEFAASQAAADARGRSGPQSAAASSISGISLQEAQQILNVATLSPDEIQKVVRAKERLDEELQTQSQHQREEDPERKPDT
ncbi:mitochondrial import inner membrane translocase subunit TIM16 isoform X2 [Hemicordylus capensis]|uniref:mitochondrial import inner membrane translocase subunit TIM16 isoform X2 n=1 Tax=Hemicordylus capensis TaxID=884348 RepID=UPI0023046E4D|nr:mitochondrial import inner membrane translocase subunit TIM16 isoform X2 [Hemicordylus capensis]